MQSIPTPGEQEVAFEKLIKLRYWRLNSNESDESIATQRLGFESAEHMYQQLKKWEWPDWSIHPAPLKHEDERKPKARRGTADRVELPPARGAIPLFKEMLDVLREAIEELEHRNEYFQDGRFVVETHIQGHAYDNGELVEFRGALAGGGEQWPPEPLTALTAIYVLAGLPLEPLLSTLNGEPGEVDFDQLDLSIEGKRTKKGHTPGLKGKAGHVARLIRVGTLRGGANTREFSAGQHEAAWRSYRLEQQGLSTKDIEQKLRKEGFGHQDVAQLRKLRLPPPTL